MTLQRTAAIVVTTFAVACLACRNPEAPSTLQTVKDATGNVSFEVPTDWDCSLDADGTTTCIARADFPATLRCSYLTLRAESEPGDDPAEEAIVTLKHAALQMRGAMYKDGFTDGTTEGGDRFFEAAVALEGTVPPEAARLWVVVRVGDGAVHVAHYTMAMPESSGQTDQAAQLFETGRRAVGSTRFTVLDK